MKKLAVFFILIALFISCSKDNSSNCDFIGTWCDEVTGCLITIEFDKNGDHFVTGGKVGTWKSADCTNISIYSAGGFQILKYRIISVDAHHLHINRGFGTEDYVR